jgi:fumarate hydratase subunit beta
MDKKIRMTTPLVTEELQRLRAGDQVLITGIIYTARDAAHKRLITCIEQGEPLPFDVDGQIIYYVGPSPAKPDQVIGAAGPTTSYRMDAYTPTLLKLGLKGMIGKGSRSLEVREAMKTCGAIYFAAIGGAGALISASIMASEVIAYEDLGAEAIRKLEVVDFPAIVAIDSLGNNLYQFES